MTWISVRSPVAFSEALFVEPQQGMVAVCFQGQSCYRYEGVDKQAINRLLNCLLYTSPSPRDQRGSRMPSSA